MGIITEEFERNNVKYVKRYSDKGMFLERDSVLYEEAIDLSEYANERKYMETDVPIGSDTEESEVN